MTEDELNEQYELTKKRYPNVTPGTVATAIVIVGPGRDEVVTPVNIAGCVAGAALGAAIGSVPESPIKPGLAIGITREDLRPMSSAPKDGTYIILFGDSGYTTTPLRCQVCHYDPEYRPLDPWQTFSNDSFEDSGTPPIGWIPLPNRDKFVPVPENEYWIFTFMSDSPHRNRYRKLYGSFVEARTKMFGLHDGAWCMQYDAIKGEVIIKNFHLEELL